MSLKNKIEEYKKAGDITIEQVRACNIFKGISDEKAKKVIEVIHEFTLIVLDYYDLMVRPNKIDEDNEPLESNKLNVAA